MFHNSLNSGGCSDKTECVTLSKQCNMKWCSYFFFKPVLQSWWFVVSVLSLYMDFMISRSISSAKGGEEPSSPSPTDTVSVSSSDLGCKGNESLDSSYARNIITNWSTLHDKGLLHIIILIVKWKICYGKVCNFYLYFFNL